MTTNQMIIELQLVKPGKWETRKLQGLSRDSITRLHRLYVLEHKLQDIIDSEFKGKWNV